MELEVQWDPQAFLLFHEHRASSSPAVHQQLSFLHVVDVHFPFYSEEKGMRAWLQNEGYKVVNQDQNTDSMCRSKSHH